MFEPADVAFLAGIGCTAQELFDFVDDSLGWDDLDYETVLAVTEIRRAKFLEVMQGQPTGRVIPMGTPSAKSAMVDGIAWLPRLIAKARIESRSGIPAACRQRARDWKSRLFLRLAKVCDGHSPAATSVGLVAVTGFRRRMLGWPIARLSG